MEFDLKLGHGVQMALTLLSCEPARAGIEYTENLQKKSLLFICRPYHGHKSVNTFS